MQIVILGAGASYDYQITGGVDGTPIKPPLTKDLVSPSYLDHKIADRYPGAGNILSALSGDIANGTGFEEALLKRSKLYARNDLATKQLIALRFYLRDLFEHLCKHFTYFNNYKLLLNAAQSSERDTCFVTFNYDTYFEQSADIKWKALRQYISGPITLVKLHGSCDWSYIFDLRGPHYIDEHETPYNFLLSTPNYIDHITKQNAVPYHEDEIKRQSQRVGKLPAIAIPLPDKQDFVCPPAHVEHLKKCLGAATRVLVIGWKGKDPHLLQVMQQHLPPNTPVKIVSGDIKGATEIKKTMSEILTTPVYEVSAQAGFGKFVSSGELENFFE